MVKVESNVGVVTYNRLIESIKLKANLHYVKIEVDHPLENDILSE